MATRETDVIVVGAGISGLTAAKFLLSKDPNLNVLVLEAKGKYLFIFVFYCLQWLAELNYVT